jgi:broad specificity phosphatase PhoE
MNKTPQPIRLFLVRHGEADHNLDIGVLRENVDANSCLTPRGWQQAIACGQFFDRFFENSPPEGGVIIFTSSYARCLQTTQGLHDCISIPEIQIHQAHAFVEQNFGDISGMDREQQERAFPNFAKRETLYRISDATFFLRPPGGESLSDVCARVRGKFSDIHRWHERGATDIIIVSHSRTLRCIAIEWMNLDYRSIFQEPPPGNCDIRLIAKGVDKGHVYTNGEETSGQEVVRRTTLDMINNGDYYPNFVRTRLFPRP